MKEVICLKKMKKHSGRETEPLCDRSHQTVAIAIRSHGRSSEDNNPTVLKSKQKKIIKNTFCSMKKREVEGKGGSKGGVNK